MQKIWYERILYQSLIFKCFLFLNKFVPENQIICTNFMHNVLYLSYDGMTDPLGQSQVLPYIIGLQKKGFNFTLISAEKIDSYKEGKVVIEQICKKNNIDWQPVIYTRTPPIISTLIDLNKLKRRSIKLHKQKKFFLVHCRGYVTALLGLYMKQKHQTGFLFDMRGLWADEKVDAGAWNLSNPFYKLVYCFYKKKEKQFFLNADYTVSLTEAGKNEITNWPYLREKNIPIKIIPCASDGDHFNPAIIKEPVRNTLLNKLGILPQDIILSYLGSTGTWYMLDEMLDFFKQFHLKLPQAKMLFITGHQHDLIRRQWKLKDLPAENLIICKCWRNEVPLYLSLSTYSIFFIRALYSKISSSPTKQGEIMAMSIPVICNSGVGDTDMIVNKYHSGILINEFSDKEYNTSIDQLLSVNFDSKKIRDGALSFFSLNEAIQNYNTIYNYILKKSA